MANVISSTLLLETSLASSLTNANAAAESSGSVGSSCFVAFDVVMMRLSAFLRRT